MRCSGRVCPWIPVLRFICLGALLVVGCAAASEVPQPEAGTEKHSDFLDTLQHRTFGYFWDLSHPETGLSPDRFPTESFASVAATGFALTAYPIGVERGYITREEARARVTRTLRFLWNGTQGEDPSGSMGYRGFFYHFLDPATGNRFGEVELSTVDTALLLAGALFCQSYFDRAHAEEVAIRELVEKLYLRVDWKWASVRPPAVSHGWNPEVGFLPYDWRGYNEAMILYLLALASPTHPVDDSAWDEWTSRYEWGEYHGYEFLGFGPLFGHQYTHLFIDFRGIQDAVMRERGLDYFENSRRALLAQRAYAIENPMQWRGYGENLWGLTACDGPVNQELVIDGKKRVFQTYWARGTSFAGTADDGTIAPTAIGGAIAFDPETVLPTLISMKETYGELLFSKYGFLDALNPTLTAQVPVQHGRVDPKMGWFDTDYLGIDQGPILAMAENHRSGLVWETLSRNPHIIRGLRRAGFQGGWLDDAPESP